MIKGKVSRSANSTEPQFTVKSGPFLHCYSFKCIFICSIVSSEDRYKNSVLGVFRLF